MISPGRGTGPKERKAGWGCRGDCPPSNSQIDQVDGGVAVGASSFSRHSRHAL